MEQSRNGAVWPNHHLSYHYTVPRGLGRSSSSCIQGIHKLFRINSPPLELPYIRLIILTITSHDIRRYTPLSLTKNEKRKSFRTMEASPYWAWRRSTMCKALPMPKEDASGFIPSGLRHFGCTYEHNIIKCQNSSHLLNNILK